MCVISSKKSHHLSLLMHDPCTGQAAQCLGGKRVCSTATRPAHSKKNNSNSVLQQRLHLSLGGQIDTITLQFVDDMMFYFSR